MLTQPQKDSLDVRYAGLPSYAAYDAARDAYDAEVEGANNPATVSTLADTMNDLGLALYDECPGTP